MLAPLHLPPRSEPPRATLVNATGLPFDNAVATARTCYSSRIITPEEVAKDERARALRDGIADSTYLAGHHTTLQHATFQFALEHVSRQAIWSFLHAHPFYNSEQVSQRYVAVKKERFFVPCLADAALQNEFEACLHAQMEDYRALTEILSAPAGEAYFDVFRARAKQPDKHAKAIGKKAQEVARYVLPIATHAHLYHTISGLTLHRYHRLCRQWDVPGEVSMLVSAMVAAVTAHDPLFFRHIEDPLPLEATHEYALLGALQAPACSSDALRHRQETDALLGGRMSALIDHSADGERTLARSVRAVLALSPTQLDDDAAIDAVMHPQRNPYLHEALNLGAHGKVTAAMHHVHYTFCKKLSHAADSQDQRHRTTPGSRPVLHRHFAGGEPDVITPSLILRHGPAQERFAASMRRTYETVERLLDAGVSHEHALYLLPNAHAIRFVESGDLLGWHHKWVSRLCYNAQEEIWRASLDEVSAVAAVHPRIARFLQPPCGLRAAARARPICPEGPRFCGVPVWKLPREQYQRTI
jgi:thymidylate synthase ThyX